MQAWRTCNKFSHTLVKLKKEMRETGGPNSNDGNRISPHQTRNNWRKGAKCTRSTWGRIRHSTSDVLWINHFNQPRVVSTARPGALIHSGDQVHDVDGTSNSPKAAGTATTPDAAFIRKGEEDTKSSVPRLDLAASTDEKIEELGRHVQICERKMNKGIEAIDANVPLTRA